MNQNDGLELIAPRIIPALDPQFRPAILANQFFREQVRASGKAVPVRLALEQADGLTKYLSDNTVSISVTTINGTVDSRSSGNLDLRSTSGARMRLQKGVRYRVTITNTTAATTTGVVSGAIILTSDRRRA